jgi:arsenate reductase (thioredoxin)
MNTRILILCTGNSCRSQMAEGILKNIDPSLQVFSAGVFPASRVSSKTVLVMKEIGIDISAAYPKNVDKFLKDSFDYVITVCDNARETCPVFTGKVNHRIHMGFEDPGFTEGTEEEILEAHRKVRDEIREKFKAFYIESLKSN